MSNTTNFPANPTNGMVHSAEDGVAFTYSSARGVWLRNSASPINVTNNQSFNEQISGTFESPTTGTPAPLASVTFDTNDPATQSTMTLNNEDSSTSRTVELYSATKVTTLLGQADNNLGSGATVNNVAIATADDVATVNVAATEAYFSALGPFIGGTRFVATNANFGKSGLDIPGSTATTAYYFGSDKSWREGDDITSNLLGRLGG